MSFWQNIFGTRSIENPKTPLTSSTLSGEAGLNKDRIEVNAETVLGIPEFNRAVQIKAGIMASLPFHISRTDGQSTIPLLSHPVTRLINVEPSPLYSAYDFISTLVTHLEIFDNFFAHIMRGNEGIKELKILDPGKVRLDENARGQLIYEYADGPDGQNQKRYSADNIFHVHGPSLNPNWGQDKIKVNKENFILALAHRDYLATFNANGSFLSGVIKHPGVLRPEAAKRLGDSWRKAYGGAKRAGSVAILEENMEFQPISATPVDAGSTSTKNAITSDISRITGVPKILLEDYADATLNNAEHIGQFFVNYTIRPLAERIEAEIFRKLLTTTEQADHRAVFDLKGLLRPDAKGQAAYIDSLMKWGIINDDEARGILGMNPKPDAQGQQFYKPVNMIDPETLADDED